MQRPEPVDPLRLLEAFSEAGVDFIVVGMVSAVLQGAPMVTSDLDLVHAQDAANIGRILKVLDEIDAYVRIQGDKKLRVDATHLAARGHRLLKTTHGRLDLLSFVADDQTYEDLLPYTDAMEVGEHRVLVLQLPKYIEHKEHAGREKDLMALPVLRAVLRERGEH